MSALAIATEPGPVPLPRQAAAQSGRHYSAMRPEPLWWQARELVAAQYRQHFNACLLPDYPRFIGLSGMDQKPVAAIGIRRFVEATPFCQRYLERPLEQVLAERAGCDIDRAGLVELGNLAVARPRLLAPMFQRTAEWLEQSGSDWIVFCLTRTLRLALNDADAELVDLGPARAEAMGPMIAHWGSYYQHDPRVMAARVGQPLFSSSRPAILWNPA